MYTIKTFFVIFIIISLSVELQGNREIDWFDSVTTHLCDSGDVHTAVIIHYHNANDSDIVKDKIFEKILRSMSSVIVEMGDEGIVLKELDFGVVTKLSTSLLFIFYTKYSGDNTKIYRVMDSISELADFAVNYLLIILRTSSNLNGGIEDILRHAWNKSLVNIVILEIRLATIFNRFTKAVETNPMFVCCNDEELEGVQVIIHLFNPFINKFYHDKFSPEIPLFPNFATNMHEHRLNVVVRHQPPFSVIEWDKNNNLKAKEGPDLELMQTIAEKLNFTPNIIRNPNIVWTLRNSTVENSIQVMKENTLDMYASLIPHLTDDIMEQSIRSRAIQIAEMGVLMPRKYKINKKNLKATLESDALTLVIIMIIWFAVILLKFDTKVWQLYSIFGLILSIPVPHQPYRNHERILFLVVTMLAFMYSNDIYASLTNLGVNNLAEHKYETFKDIADSGLTPIAINVRTMKRLSNMSEEELHWMKENLRKGKLQTCLEMAAVYRNVSCVLHHYSHMMEEDYVKDNDPLSFAKAILWAEEISFRFRQGLPGRREMNQVIARCDETGLLGKWYDSLKGSLGHKVHVNHDAQLKANLLHAHLLGQLIVIVVFGHSLAALVFIGELLTHRYWKNASERKCKIDLCRLLKTKK